VLVLEPLLTHFLFIPGFRLALFFGLLVDPRYSEGIDLQVDVYGQLQRYQSLRCSRPSRVGEEDDAGF
jgi:hypothetical protein